MPLFRNDSTEEMCMKPNRAKNSTRQYPCFRTKGHKGRCQTNEYEAADMDGVHVCCRKPNKGNHREECYQPY